MFNNQGNCFSQRINNDQSINERNKIVDEFMNYIDNKNNINNNRDDEEEDDFDKIEHEYMKKKNEEAKIKYYEDYNKIKENEEIEEKEIINDKYNRKIEYDFYNNEENNIKSNFPKQFFPRLYQNPENLYLIEAYKKKGKHKIKKIFERKIREENNKINSNNEKNKSKEKQNIRIFKNRKKNNNNIKAHSLSKNKITINKGIKEDKKNQDENNTSFDENEPLFSKYKNNKKGIKSGRPYYKRNNIFNNLQNLNNPSSTFWNNQITNVIGIQNYERTRLKSDYFLPQIKSFRNENLVNNNTFTTFKTNNLNQKSKSKSKNKNLKKNFDDYNIINNKIQFDVILNHFKKV